MNDEDGACSTERPHSRGDASIKQSISIDIIDLLIMTTVGRSGRQSILLDITNLSKVLSVCSQNRLIGVVVA